MIHYTCDCCKQPIDSKRDLRYVVRIEVYAALDPTEADADDDRDNLQELQDILEAHEGSEYSSLDDQVYHNDRFDLCSDCRTRFIKNPLGRAMSQQVGFSQN